MDYLKRSWVEIDLKTMLSNLNAVKKMCGNTTVIAVVKADAYGHGASVVAPFLEQNGVNFFAVSNVDEAMELRHNGVKANILVLGHTPAHYASTLYNNRLSQTVMSREYAEELRAAAKQGGFTLNVHIKLDTGMNRIGFVCSDTRNPAQEIAQILSRKEFRFEGLFTHFSSADTDEAFTKTQAERFERIRRALAEKGFVPEICHCSNSAAILLHNECRMDAVRAGIVLYGLTPDTSVDLPREIRPAMSFYSTVVQVKDIHKGDTVSYGRTFESDRDITAATLPVGYADGFRRALSNTGEVCLNGKTAKVLGRVCMDQTVIDVTGIEGVKAGDRVELFGGNMPVEKMAEQCDTVNYEIICGISRRVPRVYTVGGNKLLAKSYIHEEEK